MRCPNGASCINCLFHQGGRTVGASLSTPEKHWNLRLRPMLYTPDEVIDSRITKSLQHHPCEDASAANAPRPSLNRLRQRHSIVPPCSIAFIIEPAAKSP